MTTLFWIIGCFLMIVGAFYLLFSIPAIVVAIEVVRYMARIIKQDEKDVKELILLYGNEI